MLAVGFHMQSSKVRKPLYSQVMCDLRDRAGEQL